MEKSWLITAFYRFHQMELSDLLEIESELTAIAASSDLNGLIISAAEGLNGTVSGSKETLEKFKQYIVSLKGFEATIFKDSSAGEKPFKRFKIKRRDEIVTLKRADFHPDGKNNHLTPQEWHTVLTEEEDFVLIDTRNKYETGVGVFDGAVDPNIGVFTEFSDWVKDSDIPKDKKVLMYCTGGIRCEKAIYEMQEQGYKNVYQLEGGILKYLEEYPEGKFDGECFVFDHRVAVDNNLKPSSRYNLCPHCGNPGDIEIKCGRCSKPSVICPTCHSSKDLNTCSKDCSYHFRLADNSL